MSNDIDEFEGIDDVIDQGTGGVRKRVPNESAVLTLGILSIVTCWIYGIIGIILGIIALSLHTKDKQLYQSDQAGYQQSFNQSNAGKICAIIGIIFSGIVILFTLFALLIIASSGRF